MVKLSDLAVTLEVIMYISDFVAKYKNHSVLFIGTGFSLRYLENSYNWDELLSKIASDFTGNDEYYLQLKCNNQPEGEHIGMI